MALTEEEINKLLTSNRKSVLHKHKNDVLELRKVGVTYANIKRWLKDEHQLSTSSENIRQFCLRNMQVQVVAKNKQSAKKRLFENLEKDE